MGGHFAGMAFRAVGAVSIWPFWVRRTSAVAFTSSGRKMGLSLFDVDKSWRIHVAMPKNVGRGPDKQLISPLPRPVEATPTRPTQGLQLAMPCLEQDNDHKE